MIGGEFEIDLARRSDCFLPASDTYYYASGRTALYQILKSITPNSKRVWLPDYLCQTIVEAVDKAGYKYSFYELDACFMASPEILKSSGVNDGDIVLIINYFGLQDLTHVSKEIKEAFSELVIIEDDVQAFFLFTEEINPFADYRFTSLRKSLPVPDGGLVYTKRPMLLATQPNTFSEFKLRAGAMKARRGEPGVKDKEYLALFEKGEELIDDNYEAGMSSESKSLYCGIDFQNVKARRQENAQYLLNGLESLGIQPMISVPEDKVPLFVPILLPNRDAVRRKLFKAELFCPIHWPLFEGLSLKRGEEMARCELSLIVDQRYSITDMDLILSNL